MSIKLKDTISDLINKANKDGSGNTITSTYLKLSGGTLTGALTIKTGADTKLIFNNTDGEKYTKISFQEAGTEHAYVLISDSTLYWGSSTIYHSGNLNVGNLVTTNTAQTISGSKTFSSSIKINSSLSITDESGSGILGIAVTGWTGLPTDGSANGLGSTGKSLYIRSSGNNLYHYRKDKSASYLVLDESNWSSYCAAKSHTHDYAASGHTHSYLPLSGGTLTGNLTLSAQTSTDMSFTSPNPQIIFNDPVNANQRVKLIYTVYDSYRSPAGIKLIGEEANAWFEVAGGVYAKSFYNSSGTEVSYSGHTHSYLPLSGGTMNSNANITFQGTGGIQYKGSQSTYKMITFIDNTGDTYGNGISIGGGGVVLIGSGESTGTILGDTSLGITGGTETTYITSDGGIVLYSNCNNGSSSKKELTFDTSGVLKVGGTAVSLSGHTHSYAASSHTHSQYYDSGVSRTANTVLAAPNGSAGSATFRKLVAADIPTLAISKISGLQSALDGKSATGHTHSYLPLSGGTLTGVLTLKGELYSGNYALNLSNSNIVGVNSIIMSDVSEDAGEGIQFKRSNGNNDSIWANNGTLYFSPNGTYGSSSSFPTNYTVIHSGNYTSYCAASSHSHTKLNNYYSSRPSSIAPGVSGDGSMFHFKCTSSVTDTTTDPGDAHILHFNWDNTGGYDFQIAGLTSSSTMKVRGMNGGTWKTWATVLTSDNWSSYCAPASHSHSYLPLSGGTINNGALNMTNNRLRMVGTSATPAWNQAGAITWCESVEDGQPVSIVYTSYDSYRAPAGLKVMGSQGGEWFEAPKIYCSNFYIGGSEITFVT